MLWDATRAVVQAVDGGDALAKLDELARPCLVLLDLSMPRVDGLEILERLQQHAQAAAFPVVLMTGHTDFGAAGDYPGVVGRLKKPFDVGQLLALVNAHC